MLHKSIPNNAKLVFKGVIFEVWQWQQKMYDGTFATFERLKRPDTAIVISVVKDKIIILAQEQPDVPDPFTSLPGGRCNSKENPLDAAKRELLEETGYESNDWTLWNEQNPVGKIDWTIYTYIAKDCIHKQPQKLDSGEKIKTELISFDEFLNLATDKRFSEKELGIQLFKARIDKKAKQELYDQIFS